MTDKRIDAHTNTTTVADVDEFIVDSGSNGTRNITYSNLKSQILGSTSIATIGNSVTEAIYNTYTDIGDLTQTGVTGATVAAQISQLNADLAITKVPDTFITLNSGISITTNDLYKQGDHIFGWITFGFSAQTPNDLILGTINSGYRPSGRIIRMAVGLGTEPWAAEYNGYVLKEYDHTLHLVGYNNNIKSAHIHFDYVV